MTNEELEKKLHGIEHQLKFMVDAYKILHNIIIQGIHIKLEENLLTPTIDTLNNRIYEFRSLCDQLNKIVKEDSILGTLSFMAKKINSMEEAIDSIKEKGIKKKIHLDFTVDGYEMVPKKPEMNDPWEEKFSDPEAPAKELLRTLSPQESAVVTIRYGLFGCKEKTLEKTGVGLGISRERVRQIQRKALRKMKHPSRKNLVNRLTHKSLKDDILGNDKD